jgi:hypothetical protein
MLVFPLFMLISKQARHGWAHEHEQRSVEGCYIIFNWCIYLEDELQRLATETAAAGLSRRQVHGVQPRRGAAGLAGEQVAEEEAWVLRFAKDTKRHFHFFILIVVVLVIHCSGRGACWRGWCGTSVSSSSSSREVIRRLLSFLALDSIMGGGTDRS